MGIFPFEPFNFIDEKDDAQGLNPDLLREIVRDELWKIEFVPGSWAESFDRLQKQEIDLMMSVAYSPERAELMDYTYESVVELWGQVFVRPEGKSYNINNLSGLRVAVMRKDISGINFIKTAENFGVFCEILEFNTHAEVFAAVKNNKADAGVAPQHFGLRHAGEYNLIGSTILFSPFSIYFSSKKGTQHELLSHIDAHLSKWKKDKESFYYQSINHWIGNLQKRHISIWFTYSFIAAISSALIFSGFVLLLKRTVKRKTEELRESEEKFRSLAESSRDCIIRYDYQGRFTYVNPAGLAIFGVSEGEIIGKSHSEAGFSEEQSAILGNKISQVFETGKPYQMEFFRHGSSGPVYLDLHLTPEHDGKAMIASVLGVSRDITEKKQLEKIQAFLADTSTGTNNESFFYMLARFLAENLDMDFVCIDRLEGDGLTARTVAVWCDGQFEDNVSYALKDTPCGEVVGQSVCCYPASVIRFFPNDLVLKDLRAESYVGVTLVSHTGRPIGLIAVIGRQPLINRHLAEATLKMVAVRAAGEMERLDAEIALRQSEEQYRLIFNTAQEGIWGMNAMMRTTLVNPRMAAMLGYEPEEMMGRLLEDYFFQDEDLTDHFRRMEERQQGKDDHYQRRFRHKKGHSIWTSVSATALINNEGDFIGSFGMFTDITERKRAEEEKKNLIVQLHQAQKMEAIGTLAGGIAHDFNNILGAILGYSEMIKDDCAANATVVHDIDQVLKAGNRAKELVKQILAFSRQSEAKSLPVQPATIITEAIKMLRATLPATIHIEQNIDANVGSVLADPTEIHQILMNLCTNAFHAMENQGGTLTIALHKKELLGEAVRDKKYMKSGDFVQLSIKDTGVGITPEVRERIFDPYFTTKEVGKGTGMGLATVHGIVQNYGGSIVCESKLGEGTVFHISLPSVDIDVLQENTSGEILPVGKEHILLIDDEAMLLEMGKAMLERLGYQVTTTTNSIDALTIFRNHPEKFDLMITDQTMPGITGVDLARLILQIRPDMPIILCTGYSNLISEEKAKIIGIKGFVMKPMLKKDIGNLIRKVLS